MEYRQLGKTSLKVSVIGIGAEYLKKVPTEEVMRIYSLALKEGVNYFDLVWSLPKITDGLKTVLEKESSKPVIAFHLCSCISNGQYKRSRNPAECEKYLRLLLDLLNMDSAPVLNIHYVPNMEVWREVNRKGIVALAQKLKKEKLAEAISVSTHEPEVVKVAAESGLVDSIMHQVNAANHGYGARDEALKACLRLGVGVVAMKPFAGGELLKAGREVRIPAYKTGWKTLTMRVPPEATSAKLLNYTLSQPAVCTAVTGISSLKELNANLTYLNASDNEKDHSRLIETLETERTKK